MLRALTERERGALAWADGAAAAASHRPHRFHAAALGDAGLARRLSQSAELTGHSGGISALAWGEGGELLASGGEDCRLRLWRTATGELVHSLDTGHTAAVLSTCFLPGRDDQLLCCSADRQIRHLNVTKGAVRPYLVHSDRVRAVVPLDPHMFLSASEDGTVREFDVRQRPAAVHRDALAGDDSNVLVDQRAERAGRSRVRVGIYSLAVDEQRPWLMLTGGADPLLRLYDRRMLLTASGEDGGAAAGRRAQQWVACFVPSHLKAAVWDSGRHPVLAAPSAPALPGRHVTAVAFARGGAEVAGSYAGEAIYSFDVGAHARDVEALLHISDTVLRQPGRPRSHVGRRSMHAYASSQERRRSAGGRAGEATPAATAEGGGGTGPATEGPLGAAAHAAATGAQLQQRQRPAPGRGMAVALSLRQLALQHRRQLSRIAAADAAEAPRAESSRPAHWQMHPTSSTLRSPLNEVRQLHATLRQQQQAQLGAGAGPQEQQAQHEVWSDSEAPSEGFSPEGQQAQQAQQGVRRSRRIMRRRRDAAEQEQQQQQQQDAAHVDEAGQAASGAAAEEEVQQPAVSGVAEAAAGPHSCSDSEHPELASPATRRRVRRRTGAGALDVGTAAVQQQADFGEAAAATAKGSAEDGGFKAPAGRSPQQRRQAAAAEAAMHRLDSTLGLLHHHPLQQETSEVAARGAGHVQQEATVSQRQPAAAGAHCPPDRSLAAEVNSRPVLSASQAGLATQLGSLEAGHEASSLNSAEQPANERVGSVAQHGRAEAPSVGNAPLATTAAAGRRLGRAGAATAEQQDQQRLQQQAADGREASTGHWRPRASTERVVPPPPQFATAAPQQQRQVLHGTRQRRQLQPTASTGTSRPLPGGSQQQQQQRQQRYLPPAASGRLASRLRLQSEAEGGAAAPDVGVGQLGSSQAAEAPVEVVDQQQRPWGPPSAGGQGQAAPSLLQAQPQATMLSGRGPSVLGDFMPPGQEPPVDSEIQQLQREGAAAGGQVGAAQQQGQAPERAAAQQPKPVRQPPRLRQVDSNVGAIVVGQEAEGEEVNESLMYRRCYAGHLNLSGLAGGEAVPLAPPLAFLGAHSELLVSPSDDGNLFLWNYASGSLAAVLPPRAAVQPTLSTAGSPGEAAELPATAAATCVAAHPLLPMLASGGTDSVVRLWSPEAEEAACMRFAATSAHANLQRLMAAGMPPPNGGALLPAAWQGQPLDCRAM